MVDNRLGAVELTIPGNASGPPPHWHEMHDETFLITQGTVRFTWHPEGKEPTVTIDAKVGDYITVSWITVLFSITRRDLIECICHVTFAL